MKSKYKTYSKTIPPHIDFTSRIEDGINRNMFSKVHEIDGEGLYQGPNYVLSVRNAENNSKEIKIESLGIPQNKSSLQDLLKMRLR